MFGKVAEVVSQKTSRITPSGTMMLRSKGRFFGLPTPVYCKGCNHILGFA